MAGRTATKEPQNTAPAEAPTTHERHYATPAELRERAEAVRQAKGYRGAMTTELFLALAPLLHEPIDPRYIQDFPPTSGKPYASTGLRSAQVQVDRLNAILGEPHWRKLLHYTDGGSVCRAHLIVGNELAYAQIDDHGELIANMADIVATREGRGGHQQGATKGDLYKGSETNALKRTIAQLGPGHEVYTFDYDEDVNPASTAPPAEASTNGTPPAAAPDPNEQIAALLAQDDDLRELRQAVYQGMQLFEMPQDERLRRLRDNTTREQLEALQNRISIAIDERESQLSLQQG